MNNVVKLNSKTIKNKPSNVGECPQCKHDLFYVAFVHGVLTLICANCSTYSNILGN